MTKHTEPDPVGSGPACLRWEQASCAVCGATTNRVLFVARHLLYSREGSARIVRCTRCGHLYQDPRPTPDTIAWCYSDSYAPHDQPISESTFASIEAMDASPSAGKQPWYLSPLVRRVPGLRSLYYWLSDANDEPIPPPSDSGCRALEFGCGSGRYLERLQAAGWQVEGIEPADEPARSCRQRGLPVTTGSIEQIVLPLAAYDLIVAWMVLEHLHDPGVVLRQVHRALKPDGTLLFSVPNLATWETSVFRSYHFSLNEPTHLHHFSPTGVRDLLVKNGFEIRQLRFQHNLYNVVGSLGIWLQARFPHRSLGKKLLRFCDHPTMSGRLLLAPMAKVLAAVGQGGRMTIAAQRVAQHGRPT